VFLCHQKIRQFFFVPALRKITVRENSEKKETGSQKNPLIKGHNWTAETADPRKKMVKENSWSCKQAVQRKKLAGGNCLSSSFTLSVLFLNQLLIGSRVEI